MVDKESIVCVFSLGALKKVLSSAARYGVEGKAQAIERVHERRQQGKKYGPTCDRSHS